MAIKKKLRTFRVQETFNDPYISKIWQPGDNVQEEDLIKSGWHQIDIDRAIGSLLIPHIMPVIDPLTEEVNDGED